MMQRIGILFFIVLCPLFGLGQFEYFNQVIGETDDLNSEACPDIEVMNDGTYSLWGGGFQDGEERFFFRLLDDSANELSINSFMSPETSILLGTGGSYSFVAEHNMGYLTRTRYGDGIVRGLMIKIDASLDTLWSSEYYLYDDFTDFFTHTYDGLDFIVAGEYGLAPGERGTFIAMLDTAGQVLWHESIHAPSEGVFRNRDISAFEDGFIVSGASGTGGDTEGRIEWLNETGVLEQSFQSNEPANIRGIMRHFVNTEGEIIVAQSIAYEDYITTPESLIDYTYLNLFRLDLNGSGLNYLGTYFDNHEWIVGGAVKLIEGSNGSTIVMGNTSTEVGNNLNYISFILSLDSSFNLEWYTELAYDPCLTCTNTLYDLEVAPDGGYVMVGKFDNQDDPYDKTWLVKVDACGDLEWQGCENPDGLWEQQLVQPLSIYPNPLSGGELNIRFPQEVIVEKVVLIDALGRISNSLFLTSDSGTNKKFEILKSEMAPGLYSLLITTRDGDEYSGKVVIE